MIESRRSESVLLGTLCSVSAYSTPPIRPHRNMLFPIAYFPLPPPAQPTPPLDWLLVLPDYSQDLSPPPLPSPPLPTPAPLLTPNSIPHPTLSPNFTPAAAVAVVNKLSSPPSSPGCSSFYPISFIPQLRYRNPRANTAEKREIIAIVGARNPVRWS